jgi:hypothetical protein
MWEGVRLVPSGSILGTGPVRTIHATMDEVCSQEVSKGVRTRMVPGAQPPKPQPPPLYETQLVPPKRARWLSPVKTQFCCATPG